jgi:hypothetical protein
MTPLKKVVVTVALVAFAATPLFFDVALAKAQTVFQGFGGVNVGYNFNPIGCVPHTVIFDYVTRGVYGLAPGPGSEVYKNFDLVTTGKFLLGNRSVIPIPCVAPYPVYNFSKIGTS